MKAINRNFHFINAGTIYQICPKTKKALKWMQENLQTDGWQWLGKTLCVDHRIYPGVKEFIHQNFS